MNLVEFNNTSFSYENKLVAKDISFTVSKGDYLCIIGENGSGKSTLMKGILGLVKPCKGSIFISEELKDSTIGYIPQQSDIQRNFPATVYEVVLSGCIKRNSLFPFYRKSDKVLAHENMEKMKISDLKNKCYSDLSGGQQQRVLIARALCATDKLIVMDEPITGLDQKTTLNLYGMLHNLNKNYGLSIIMVSHDIKTSLNYANKVVHMKNRMLFYGDVKDYKQSECGKKFLGGEIND